MKLLTEWTSKDKRFDTLVQHFAVSGGRENEEEGEGEKGGRRRGGEREGREDRKEGRSCFLAHWRSQHSHFLCSGTPPVDLVCPTTCWNLCKDYRDTNCCWLVCRERGECRGRGSNECKHGRKS